jgi:hypothetical protein
MKLLAGLVVLGLVPASGALGGTITAHRIDDGFGGAVIDQSIWGVADNDPADVSIGQHSGFLVVKASATAVDGFGAGVATRCQISGNFDARVSFKLDAWPAVSNVFVDIRASGDSVWIQDSAPGTMYAGYFPPAPANNIPTNDRAGQLRLKRVRATATAYVKEGTTWVAIGSGATSQDPTNVAVEVFNGGTGPFGGQPVKVRFGAFHLKADSIAC